MRKIFSLKMLTVSFFLLGCTDVAQVNEGVSENDSDTHPIVAAARDQIGVVTKYDTGYYGGDIRRPIVVLVRMLSRMLCV